MLLALKSVVKRYGDYLAVDSVSLGVPEGKIYALLGPNGAGKTSIIRMITGITIPDEGEILFNGETLQRSHRSLIGYMPEERGLYPKMKVREQAIYLLNLKGMNPGEAKRVVDEWLEKLDLAAWANHKTNDLSKGMQQKLQFIVTIAHKPKLLILDEPFSGLDPVNTQIMKKEIETLREQGTTIIFSTHRMEQVEELCEYICLVNKGKILLEDTIESVREAHQSKEYFIKFSGDASALETIAEISIISSKDNEAIVAPGVNQSASDLLRSLAEAPIDLLHFSLPVPRLNDIFIKAVSQQKAVSTAANTLQSVELQSS